MSSSRVEGEDFFRLDTFFYHNQVNKVIGHLLPQFVKAVRSYVVFNLLFLILLIAEVGTLLFAFTFLEQSSLLAFSFAIIFLTIFCYFILRVYLHSRRPAQFEALRNRFVKACKSLIHYEEEIPEHHVALANACCKFATDLEGKESTLYRFPRWFSRLAYAVEEMSRWWHWEDFFRMREQLYMTSVEEHIKLAKCEPTNLEVHAALANAYVMLSALYAPKREGEEEARDPSEAFLEEMTNKFRLTAERATEEFKILNAFAPDDPWVHVQLAYSYHDLQMPLEEIREYETVLEQVPEDKETLFKLGVLYFQNGFNAKGLQVYEELKMTNLKKAEQLITYYGAYKGIR